MSDLGLHKRRLRYSQLPDREAIAMEMIASVLARQKGGLAHVNGAKLFRRFGFELFPRDLTVFYYDVVHSLSCVQLDGSRWVLFSAEKTKTRRGKIIKLVYKRL